MSAAFIDFQELKSRLSIADLLAPLELKLVRKGEQFRGPCPACKSGGDRALVVTPAKGAFYCFGAKQGGDLIGLAAHVLAVDMKAAANWIAARLASPAPQAAVMPKRPEEPVKSLQPLAYLDPAHEAVAAAGIDAETAGEWGIGYAPKGTMRGRVLFPIRDRAGTLQAYCGLGENPRWLLPSNFDPAAAIFAADKIAEGELRIATDPLDVLSAFANGVQALCFLTETVSSLQLEMLASLLDETKAELIF